MLRLVTILPALLFSATVIASTPCQQNFSHAQLLRLKSAQFQPADLQDINHTAIALLPCIGHADPAIRDGVVYEAYQHWLRNDQVAPATVRQLLTALLNNLQHSQQDPEQFRTAFSALILSEVVRVDQQQPYMTAEQRQHVVDTIAQFMRGITDYRGFNDQQGWRHSVAHSADVILQLSLNAKLSQAQAETLLSAIASQVAPKQHFYHFGEPKRLALPVLYLLINDKVSSATLLRQLQHIADPAPFASWQAVYHSEQGLAKLHNTRSFFEALFILSSNSQNDKLQALNSELVSYLKTLN